MDKTKKQKYMQILKIVGIANIIMFLLFTLGEYTIYGAEVQGEYVPPEALITDIENYNPYNYYIIIGNSTNYATPYVIMSPNPIKIDEGGYYADYTIDGGYFFTQYRPDLAQYDGYYFRNSEGNGIYTGTKTFIGATGFDYIYANHDILNENNESVFTTPPTYTESTYDVTSSFNGYTLTFTNTEDVDHYEIIVYEEEKTLFNIFNPSTYKGAYTVYPENLLLGNTWTYNGTKDTTYTSTNRYTFTVNTIYKENLEEAIVTTDENGTIPNADWIGFTPTYQEVADQITAELKYNKVYITSETEMQVFIKMTNDNMNYAFVADTYTINQEALEFALNSYGLFDGDTVTISIYDKDNITDTGLIAGTTFSYLTTNSSMTWKNYTNTNQVANTNDTTIIQGNTIEMTTEEAYDFVESTLDEISDASNLMNTIYGWAFSNPLLASMTGMVLAVFGVIGIVLIIRLFL